MIMKNYINDNKVMNERIDLTFLDWDKIRSSSGTAGSFLKSYMMYKNKKVYFKLSDYNYVDGIVGHECVNEIIVDRLLTVLGIDHLNYYLINADIKIENKLYNTYLCASLDYKNKGESKIALETYYELNKLNNETILDFCKRLGFSEYVNQMILVDYLILNRDRHGANIEILINNKTMEKRFAPLFDHGLSFICRVLDESLIDKVDVLEDKRTNSFLGSASTYENLLKLSKDELPKVNKLEKTDKEYIFYDLEKVISKKRIDKIWEMIWKRWCVYEDLCNKE